MDWRQGCNTFLEASRTHGAVRAKKRYQFEILMGQHQQTSSSLGQTKPVELPLNSHCQGTQGLSRDRCENNLGLCPARAYSVYSNSNEPSISKAGRLGSGCESKLFTANFSEWPQQESSVMAEAIIRVNVNAPTIVSIGTTHRAQASYASLRCLPRRRRDAKTESAQSDPMISVQAHRHRD